MDCQTYEIPLAKDTTVKVCVHEEKVGDYRQVSFVNVHDDENIAAEAARRVVAAHGGRLVELKHVPASKADRIRCFPVGDYMIDPNRIFTETGRARSKYGSNNEVLAEVSCFARTLLDKFILAPLNGSPPRLVVAVHNNHDLTLGSPEISIALDREHLKSGDDVNASDFILVTRQSDYEKLEALQRNLALQNNGIIWDKRDDVLYNDGSLSVYFGVKNDNKIPYVNVEVRQAESPDAKENAVLRQMNMIMEIVVRLLA